MSVQPVSRRFLPCFTFTFTFTLSGSGVVATAPVYPNAGEAKAETFKAKAKAVFLITPCFRERIARKPEVTWPRRSRFQTPFGVDGSAPPVA